MKCCRMIRKIFVALIVSCLSFVAGAQDIHFSQFFDTPLLRNPSLAGIFTGDIRVQAVYRDQWNSVTNAYRTGSLNAEYKMPVGKSEDFVTAGLQLLYDRAGTIGWTSTHVLPALNYHKSISKSRNRYLSLGFMGGWVQRRIDRSKITTNTTFNGGGDGENFVNTQFSYLDGSVGLSYNSDIDDNPSNNFFVGAAYHHFNKPRNSFYANEDVRVAPKWVLSGGVRFGVAEYAYLTIQADQSMQDGFKETVAGVLYALKLGQDPDKPDYTIHGGALLRWNDALIPMLQIDYSPFSVAVSYDVNISQLKPSSYGRGGFELSVSYIGFVNRASSSVNFTHCPRF
jgi:type IX secretion system PorP/SprF family membrane protein